MLQLSREVYLLKLMDTHWHIIVTQSPYFILEFTILWVESMDLNKYMITSPYHYKRTQNNFIT